LDGFLFVAFLSKKRKPVFLDVSREKPLALSGDLVECDSIIEIGRFFVCCIFIEKMKAYFFGCFSQKTTRFIR
jgi:hypothetical protein